MLSPKVLSALNQRLFQPSGIGSILQDGTITKYFLGDALRSVRQLALGNGEVTLTQSYQPYGEVLSMSISGIAT